MNKNQVDVIIDIETLGTDVDAKIIAIGAVALVNGEIVDTGPATATKFHADYRSKHSLHQVVNRLGSNDHRSSSIGTQAWWSQQSAALIALHDNPSAPDLVRGLQELSGWCQGLADNYDVDIRPWGNGSVFDVSILEHAFKQCSLDIPWKFWNIRDVRTLIEAAGIDKKYFEFQGTQHYALADAYHEARLLSAAMARLRGIADE